MQVQITFVQFDFSGLELEGHILESLGAELWNKIVDKVYTFDSIEDANDNVADAISDDTGWCVLNVEYVLV